MAFQAPRDVVPWLLPGDSGQLPPGLGALLRLSPMPSLEQRAVTDSSVRTQLWQFWGRKQVVLR